MALGVIFSSQWMVIFSICIFSILGTAYLLKNRAFDQIEYKRKWHYRRGFPGETTKMQLIVENRKWLPVSWLRTTDSWPRAAAPLDETALSNFNINDRGILVNLYSLRWFERIVREYTLQFKERGVYPVGPTRLESGDVFGLYESEKEVRNIEYLTVFPEVLSLDALKINTQDPFGAQQAFQSLFEDPNRPMAVRPYQPEDDMRRVHWPATARTGKLQVKVYQPITAKVMMVCLNITTSAKSWVGIDHNLVEYLIKMAATVCYHSIDIGYSVGLLSNGCLTHSDQPFRILPGRSTQQLAILLESLANVTTFVNTDFPDYLIRSMPHVPYGSTLVLITSVISDELAQTLIKLKRYRSNTTLLAVTPEPPPDIPGIRIIHLPFIEEAA
jgi:uncharacterized protein (DUF58 family)